jgi:hypothetical protein
MKSRRFMQPSKEAQDHANPRSSIPLRGMGVRGCWRGKMSSGAIRYSGMRHDQPGLPRAARPLPPSADIGPGGQSVGQAAQFCLDNPAELPAAVSASQSSVIREIESLFGDLGRLAPAAAASRRLGISAPPEIPHRMLDVPVPQVSLQRSGGRALCWPARSRRLPQDVWMPLGGPDRQPHRRASQPWRSPMS